MGFMDTIKDKFGMAKAKGPELAQQHGDKIESGMDKAAHAVDSRTHGKYTDKIETGTTKAKDALGNLKGKDGNPPT